MGPLEKTIREKIEKTFEPEYYELENESHSHSVPEGSETHFRLVLVSEAFIGKSRLDRSRMVTDLLKNEMSKGGIHALSQRGLTPAEWEAVKDSFVMASPACRGGAKKSTYR